jgi:hypothetical protein
MITTIGKGRNHFVSDCEAGCDIAATIGAVLSRVQYPGRPGPDTTRP